MTYLNVVKTRMNLIVMSQEVLCTFHWSCESNKTALIQIKYTHFQKNVGTLGKILLQRKCNDLQITETHIELKTTKTTYPMLNLRDLLVL